MKLPYAYGALEPFIDVKTVEIHHDKHHQTYVDNLNKALEKHPNLQGEKVEELLKEINSIPEDIRAVVKNNAGGVLNHNIYWEILTGNKNEQKFEGNIAKAIIKKFGSYEKFKELLSDAAMKRFGSGWAWLVLHKNELEIYSTANQDSPISEGKIPVIALDVWEHAYYLKYANKRADYVNAFFNVINWKRVNEMYEGAFLSGI
jgi:Fe-Mn family superoxide dismutase